MTAGKDAIVSWPVALNGPYIPGFVWYQDIKMLDLNKIVKSYDPWLSTFVDSWLVWTYRTHLNFLDFNWLNYSILLILII